jgi:hypothetical protein
MAGFAPSVESAQAALGANSNIVTGGHPTGAKGAAVSLNEVARRILRGRNDPRVAGWAGRALTHKAGCKFIRTGKHDTCSCSGNLNPKGTQNQVQALLNAMRAQTYYTGDPVSTEKMNQAVQTLCLDEHGLCMPAGDCDDRCITLGSAAMSIGIPVKVIGQGFDSSKIPTHVIIAVQDTKDNRWIKVDPSSEYDVGRVFPATHEDWIDPTNIPGAELTGGTFVGVGFVPRVGLGQATAEQNVIQQVEMAVYTLTQSRNDLQAALSQISTARSLLGAAPYDPEPSYAVTDLSNFPSDGTWTQSMAEISEQILSVASTLIQAGQQALSGVRQILVYANIPDVFIGALPSDSWSIKAVAQTAMDTIYGFFSPSGTPISGFSASTGAVVSQTQITQEASAAVQSNGTVQGVVGVGQDPTSILLVGVIGGALVYYTYSKYCAVAETKAKEATTQALLKCLTTINPATNAPVCTPDDIVRIQNALSQARVAEKDAQTRNDAADPFTKFIDEVASGVKWLVIGGIVVGGVVLAFPLIEEGVAGLTEKLAARRAATAASRATILPPAPTFGERY